MMRYVKLMKLEGKGSPKDNAKQAFGIFYQVWENVQTGHWVRDNFVFPKDIALLSYAEWESISYTCESGSVRALAKLCFKSRSSVLWILLWRICLCLFDPIGVLQTVAVGYCKFVSLLHDQRAMRVLAIFHSLVKPSSLMSIFVQHCSNVYDKILICAQSTTLIRCAH